MHSIRIFIGIFACAALAHAGSIYGTIKQGDEPLEKGIAVRLLTVDSIPVVIDTTRTGAIGTYSLFWDSTGPCRISVEIGAKPPVIAAHSFSKRVQYNLVLEAESDSVWTLRRK